MDLDESEVARLRQEILAFLIHEMTVASANGELREAGAELAAPIAALVEEAVHRAIDRRPATRDGVLTEADLQVIARMVGSMPPPPRAVDPSPAAVPDNGGHAMRDLNHDIERARQADAPADSDGSTKAYAFGVIGLALGAALGVAIATLMGGDGHSGSAGEPVERVAPTSTGLPTGIVPSGDGAVPPAAAPTTPAPAAPTKGP